MAALPLAADLLAALPGFAGFTGAAAFFLFTPPLLTPPLLAGLFLTGEVLQAHKKALSSAWNLNGGTTSMKHNSQLPAGAGHRR